VTRLKVAVLGGIVLLLGLFLLVRLTTERPVARDDVVWACGRKVLPGYRGIPSEARDAFADFRKVAGCSEPQQGGSDIVAEPRRVPKPKQCSEYSTERQILLDEQAGRLTKADKQWLDMDGDGRYCEERGVAWKGERTQAQ